jgi:hypothetical protein
LHSNFFCCRKINPPFILKEEGIERDIGVGTSAARGDYPSEYDARVEFSFSPGLRLRLDESFAPNTFIFVDVGFLKTGFVGYVAPADYYFWRTYEYVNFNTMFGSQLDILYLAGGLYFGIGTDAYEYDGWYEEYQYFDSNPDFGLVGEVGFDILPFLSLGAQGRFGLKSIGTSVDIKNWGLLATVGIHFYRF